MRVYNEVVTGDTSASFNSKPLVLDHMAGFALQMVFTGTMAGSVKLQGSCDAGSDSQGTGVATWFDLSGLTGSITNNTTIFLTQADAMYKWVRIAYTRSTGSGTMVATLNAKGV